MDKNLNSALILSTVLFIASCSSGGGGSSEPAKPIGDITGIWSVTETVDGTACGDGINVATYNLNVVSQSGNAITYNTDVGTFKGTLSGAKLTSSGSYPDDGGTVTGDTTLTIDSVCSAFSGTASWSWSDGTESCSGTSTLEGIRINSTGCGTVTDVSSSSETEPNDSPEQADLVTAGKPINGDINSSPENDDFYKFTTPEAGNYLIKLDYNSAIIDIGVLIYDGSLNLLGIFEDKTIDANGLTAGEIIYLQLDPIATNGTLSYTLTVSKK